MGSLSKIIFLECQKQLPSFHSITNVDGDQLTDQQLSPSVGVQLTPKPFQTSRFGTTLLLQRGRSPYPYVNNNRKLFPQVTHGSWIDVLKIHISFATTALSSLSAPSVTTHDPLLLLESPLALQLYCAQTFSSSRHKTSLPTHGSSSDTTSLCREGLLGTVKSSQIHSLQHKTYFLNLPFSQGRSCPNPSSDYQLSCSSLSCPLQDANCRLPLGSNENNECVHTVCTENISKSG